MAELRLTQDQSAQNLLLDVDFLESINSSNPLEQAVAVKHFLQKALENAEELFNEIREKHGRLDVEEMLQLFTKCVELSNSTQNSEPQQEQN